LGQEEAGPNQRYLSVFDRARPNTDKPEKPKRALVIGHSGKKKRCKTSKFIHWREKIRVVNATLAYQRMIGKITLPTLFLR
jgi:hypothetical protein